MKTNLIVAILTTLVLSQTSGKSFGQVKEGIDIRFLGAKFTDTLAGKTMIITFLVSTADTADFPPVVNLPPKCTVFENGREKVVLFNSQNLSVSLDGDKIASTNKPVYEMVRDKIDLSALKTAMIITYTVKNLNYLFKKMTMTPSFEEKRHKQIKVQKRVEFEVH